MVIMVALSLIVVCFTACTGNGNEIPSYTGPFLEDGSTTSTTIPLDISSTSTTTAPSTENVATTVLIPLTTVPGGTVPTVITTEYTTEFVTMDYTPLDVSTTKPPVYTTYVNPTYPGDNTTRPQQQNTTTTKKEEEQTTEKKISYVDVYSGDVFISVNADGTAVDLAIPADDFGIKMEKSSGKATVNVNGTPYKVSYSVAAELDADDCIAVTVELPSAILQSGDTITVTMSKGSFTSTKKVSNNKFTTMSCVY